MFSSKFWSFLCSYNIYFKTIIIQPASRYKGTSPSTSRSYKATQNKSGSTRAGKSPRPQSSSPSVPRPKSQNHSAAAKKSPGDRDRFISTAERVISMFEQIAPTFWVSDELFWTDSLSLNGFPSCLNGWQSAYKLISISKQLAIRSVFMRSRKYLLKRLFQCNVQKTTCIWVLLVGVILRDEWRWLVVRIYFVNCWIPYRLG